MDGTSEHAEYWVDAEVPTFMSPKWNRDGCVMEGWIDDDNDDDDASSLEGCTQQVQVVVQVNMDMGKKNNIFPLWWWLSVDKLKQRSRKSCRRTYFVQAYLFDSFRSCLL